MAVYQNELLRHSRLQSQRMKMTPVLHHLLRVIISVTFLSI
jgi:hypothetical protein